jgi:protein-tyrosine phosphatase
MIQHVLVVCIGNICRSPIGEALLASLLREKHPSIVVSSAGLAAMSGHPADPTSVKLLHAKNMDISHHQARQATSEIIFDSDLILTTTLDQKEQIEKQYPGARGRVHRLGHWGGFDIPDPYKRPEAIFEQAFLMIEQGVDEWYRTLWN